MKTLLNLGVALFLVVGLQSCDTSPCGSTPASFLDKLDRLVNQVSDKKKDLKEEDWTFFDEQFENMTENCYDQHSAQMKTAEIKRFLGLSARYVYLRGSGGMINFFRKNADKASIIRNELEELDTRELQKLMQDVSEDVESIGNKIEDFFND